jgi:hypothetical protein
MITENVDTPDQSHTMYITPLYGALFTPHTPDQRGSGGGCVVGVWWVMGCGVVGGKGVVWGVLRGQGAPLKN